ncbi:U3 snoRNP protein, partial [Elasticomyces elasticus]
MTPTPADPLTHALKSTPQIFLQPPRSLHASALALLKATLDPLAEEVGRVQGVRAGKRKRGSKKEEEESLRLKRVHVEGFPVEVVWEQVLRVVEGVGREVGREVFGGGEDGRGGGRGGEDGEESGLGGDGEESGLGGDGEESGGGGEESGLNVDGDVDVDGEGEGLTQDEDGDEDGEGMDGLEEEEAEEGFGEEEDVGLDGEGFDEVDTEDEGPAEEFVPDPNGLNDGFFSIDNFNRQSQFLEQRDAKGDDDGAVNDEDEIDWGADPLGTDSGAALARLDREEEEDEDEEEQGDGPTFGNIDLNAPEGESDDEDRSSIEEGEMDGLTGISNTNNILYADFFAPPAQKARKNKKGRPNPHNFPAKPAAAPEPDENGDDIERTMSAVHRDLFEDDVSANESEDDDLPELDPADPKSRRSNHERRRAALAEEIRKLEAANVAKREWTLSGEARAADRPLNSLLEEDLEFERAGKPVPVITAE